MLTQLPRVPSLIPSSFATRAIGRDVSITIFTASSLNSGEKLFFGRGNYFTFPDVHPNGWTVRKLRGTSGGETAPPRRGRGPWNRAPSPPRHAGRNHARTPPGNRLNRACRTSEPQHPRKPQIPKVRGVGIRPRVSNAITGVATENRHAGQKHVLHGTSEYLRRRCQKALMLDGENRVWTVSP